MDQYNPIESHRYRLSFGDLYRKLDAYRSSLMTNYLNQQFGASDADNLESSEKKESDARNALDLLETELSEIGLVLERRKDDQYEAPTGIVSIINGEKFLTYLKGLGVLSTEDKDSLKGFLGNTAKAIIYRYQFETDTDTMLDLHRFFPEIVSLIKEKSELSEESSREFILAESFIQPMRGWFTKEHVTLLKIGLFQEGFGPSAWHGDMTPERYQDKWVSILAVVDSLKENDRAQGYRENVIKVVKDSLGIAIGDLEHKSLTEEQAMKTHYLKLLEIAKASLVEVEKIK